MSLARLVPYLLRRTRSGRVVWERDHRTLAYRTMIGPFTLEMSGPYNLALLWDAGARLIEIHRMMLLHDGMMRSLWIEAEVSAEGFAERFTRRLRQSGLPETDGSDLAAAKRPSIQLVPVTNARPDHVEKIVTSLIESY